MALRISRAIPYFCGLPYEKRMARRIVTLRFTTFVDDSGGDGRSSHFVLGAWVGRCDIWEKFSDAWEISIEGPPQPLQEHEGKKYFRHTEAITGTGCFTGFTPLRAVQKTWNLAWLAITLGRYMAGYTVTVPLRDHESIVQERAIKRQGKAHHLQRLPFYLAFKNLVPDIYSLQWEAGFRDPIDIIVDGDKTDKALDEMISVFESVKAQSKSEPWHSTIGDIFPRSAKDLPPLQLADMLAGQTRLKYGNEEHASILRLWKEHEVRIVNRTVSRAEMEEWSRMMNTAQATRVLTKIKKQYEGGVLKHPAKRRGKK